MIYLIDDKKKRQGSDLNWDEQRLSRFSNVLYPIYDLETLEHESQKIFSQGNVVIYHESFLNGTQLEAKASEKRILLESFANKNPNFKLVIFSGSKDSRKLNGNLLHIPVGTLYANLETFIKNNLNLNYLSFGENIEVEPFVYNQLEESVNNFSGTANVSGNVLFVNSPSNSLYEPILNADEVNCFDWQTNSELDKLVREWLSEKVYKNIFIPMCFGNTFSDYNGLRLATHIRCTKTLNQFTPIHIYSPVDISMLLDNEYFNILKTKNIELVAFSKKAFEDAANRDFTDFKKGELSQEISKLKLDPPLNYADSHSITNEWAIHQWAKTIGCDETDELEKVFQNIETNLYFKYLRTINPISEVDKIPHENLKINFKGKPKVLLIDDEAEKGWCEIFAYILDDLNSIYIDYLGDNFKNQSQEEIIDKSIKKIKEDDIDLVILDFRLNPDDFIGSSPKDISSIRLLKKIKELNRGIQVIIFSATNKIWNLQALQEVGADGFIFKDGSENIHQTINYLTDQMSLILKKASWLKPIWSKTRSIIKHLENQRKNHILDKDFTGAINTFLELGFESLLNEQNKFSYDSAFMYYFLILEAISKQLIDEDNPQKTNYINIKGESLEGFKFQFRSNYNFLKDYKGNKYMKVAPGEDLISKNTRIPYDPKFHNLISSAGIEGVDPIAIVDLRNKFNHPNLIENRRTAVIERENVNSIFEVCNRLLNNL